jgi:hypothetical protein
METQMISKEKFCKILKELEEAEQQDNKFSLSISEFFDCTALRYVPTDSYTRIIVDLLNEMFDLESYEHIGTDLEYFIYDLDWGKKWKSGIITDKDGTDIDISTADKLYDYFIESKKEVAYSEIIMGC